MKGSVEEGNSPFRPALVLAQDQEPGLRAAVILLVYFLLGPLLMFAALVAADARGGSLRDRIHREAE
ncbi:MAG TPA: hypothetical protein VGC63_08185, partial [Solirubrobacterales bacterium]